MKKLISVLIFSTIVSTANAIPASPYIGTVRTGYATSYDNGYRHGKSAAYNNVARTAVIVGTMAIAGIIIYQLGKESCWGVSQNGLTYKF